MVNTADTSQVATMDQYLHNRTECFYLWWECGTLIFVQFQLRFYSGSHSLISLDGAGLWLNNCEKWHTYNQTMLERIHMQHHKNMSDIACYIIDPDRIDWLTTSCGGEFSQSISIWPQNICGSQYDVPALQNMLQVNFIDDKLSQLAW